MNVASDENIATSNFEQDYVNSPHAINDLTPVMLFDDNMNTDENEGLLYESDEFFETKSNESMEKTSDDDNIVENNININALRSNLKDIENDFRNNIANMPNKASSTDNRRSYIHNKGKAPRPPQQKDGFRSVSPVSLAHNVQPPRSEQYINSKETEI